MHQVDSVAEHPSHAARAWLTLALAMLGLALLIGFTFYKERTSLELAERDRLAAMTRVLNDNISQHLESINRALLSISAELPMWQQTDDGPRRAADRLAAFAEVMTGVRTFVILDAEGTIWASNHAEVVGKRFSDRDYFRIPLEAGNPDKTYLIPPFETALGVRVMNLSRIIIGADGKFAGVVAASFDPETFRTLLGSVLFAPDSWSAIAHGDGWLFLTVPEQPEFLGTNLNVPGSFFSRHAESGEVQTVLTGMVYTSGESRMMGQHNIAPEELSMNAPLVVAVSRDIESIFASWRQNAVSAGALYVLLLVAATSALAWTQQRERFNEAETARANRALSESEARFRRLFEKSHVVMLVVEPELGIIMEANQAAAEFYGYPLARLVGSPTTLINTVNEDDMRRARQLALAGEQNHFYHRHKLASGELRDVEVSSTPVTSNGKGLLFAIIHDITEHKRAESELERIAHFDALTGLPNRVLLADRLQRAIVRCDREGSAVHVAFIDLDGFKTINDNHGHETGDEVLSILARRMKSALRETDTLARFGGDEFVAVIEDLTNPDELEEVLTRLLETAAEPMVFGKEMVSVTASVGIAIYPGDGDDADELIRHADQAMYFAKQSGKNRVRIYGRVH